MLIGLTRVSEILLKSEIRPFQSLSVSWGFWFVDLARLIQKAVFRAAGLKKKIIHFSEILIETSGHFDQGQMS